MTFPTFASGDVLTATDMNAVGLWLVKTQTIGTGVATVNVTGAFSSTYDHYLITVQVDSIAAGGPYMTLKMGATATGYYYGGSAVVYSTNLTANISTNNGTTWDRLGPGATGGMVSMIQVMNPNKAENTFIWSQYTDPNTAGSAGSGSGFLNNTTAYTDFTIGVTSSTMTGGTIRVYGYRN